MNGVRTCACVRRSRGGGTEGRSNAWPRRPEGWRRCTHTRTLVRAHTRTRSYTHARTSRRARARALRDKNVKTALGRRTTVGNLTPLRSVSRPPPSRVSLVRLVGRKTFRRFDNFSLLFFFFSFSSVYSFFVSFFCPVSPRPFDFVPVVENASSAMCIAVLHPILRALYGLFTGGATSSSSSAVRVTIKEDCKSLLLSNEQLTILMEDMDKAIRNGLGKETNPSSIVKCYVTYVQDLPNGKERGKFLALDLGGTNFRVLLIELGENNYFHMDSEIYKVPEHIQTGKGTELFDHIAKCLAEFVKKHNLDNKNALPLGFTFSFPLRQVGLTKGYLNSWTKGFNCSGVVDEDVVRLLKDAIKRRKDVEIDVCGILNDTTGTIMSCAWKNPNTRIGLIVGTGCNACYVEKIENTELFDGDKSKSHVIVNTEWGAFGDDGKLDAVRTKYDRSIDEDSLNPGQQRFEKMISGMYMGEIVRLAIVDLANQNKLFEGRLSEKMKTKGAFGTSYVSDIESDKANYRETLKVLNEMGINDPSLVDCANVRYICECVSRRSAHLVSAGLAVLLNKMDEKSVTIGVDGSVYRFHPYFHKLMVEKTKQLTRPDIKFDLMLSEDGSGRGAALVAAVAVRDELPQASNGVAAK